MMTEKPKILIVDDKPENLYALDQLLKQLDVEVIQSLSGAEALNLALEHDFCVAIVDIQMPEMDGYELVELLRSNEGTATLPAIFVSAIYSDEYHHRKGYEAGAVDFMSKPFIPEILLSKIQVFMDLYQQRRSLQEEVKQRRQAETALQASNADLQELSYQLYEQKNNLLKLTDELEAMTTTLQVTNDKLSKLNADKNKLFSIISHDLRSPFSSFLGGAQFMVKKVDKLSQQEIREIAQSIYNEARTVYNLLENLLAWAQVQQEKGLEYCPELFDLRGIAEETVKLFEQTAAKKEIEVSNTIDTGCMAQADRRMVEMVLRNLTGNAIKFTPRGGRVILAAAQNKDTPAGFVRVSVQDTGLGIKPDDLPKLFRIETQHTTKGTENERGSGLGLTLCKEMVERNGGQIWVESDGVPGHGTTMTFTVPVGTIQTPGD
jgi:signal transduction histidine kinase